MILCRSALLLALAAAVCAATAPAVRTKARKVHQGLRLEAETTCENVEELWFTGAVVDNYAPIEEQQPWFGNGQRYFLNKQFWGGPGHPIFVFIGGEGTESCSRLTSRMYSYTQAQNHKALLVDLEHRFYGKSYPTADMSNENIKYLTSTQALADLARFITWLKEDLGATSSKIITIGGSYPGNMAAWFRLKYPHITDGSIASSAPVLAQENFPEYMDVVASAMRYFGGADCYNRFKTAADAVQAKLDAKDLATLNADFKTCEPAVTPKDQANLLSWLMGNVQGTVQYNNEKNNIMNVTNICNTMAAGPDPYTQFVQLADLYLEENKATCLDVSYSTFMDEMNTIEFDGTGNYRQWYYQTCNEFGYYQTTDSKNQPFHSWKMLNLTFYTDVCEEVYGLTSPPQIQWMNDYYGDRDIAGTNIVLPSGTIDPWHALGVTSQKELSMATEYAIFIEPTAHCHDLYAPSWDDPPQLTAARQQIDAYLAEWLSSDKKKDDDDDSDNTAVIVGATVGVTGAVLLGSGGYYMYRKNQAADPSMSKPLTEDMH